MMWTRILIGVPVSAVLLALAVWGPLWSHYLLIVLFAAVAGIEAFVVLERARLPNFAVLGTVAGTLFVVLQIWGLSGDQTLLFLMGLLGLCFLRQLLEGPHDRAVVQIAGTLVGFVYVFVLMTACVRIIQGGEPSRIGNVMQLFSKGDAMNHSRLLLFVIVVTKCGDTGAYFTGRLLGRNKLAPRLSPGKTWEGCIGGLVFAVAAAFGFAAACGTVRPYEALEFKLTPGFYFTVKQVAVSALVIAVAGIFGDLAESLIKRSARVKDSSSWLPGLGGVLDMIDSVLFAAPAFYLLLVMWQ